MTLLIWLAASSLAWGAILWITGRLLQRSSNVSGRARQWIWRGATALLVAPWLAAPIVILFGLGLAPAETTALATVSNVVTGDTLTAMHALELANVETTVVENGGSVMAMLAAANPFEIALMVVIAGWLVRFVLAQHALKSLLGIVNMSRPASAGVARGFVGNWARRLKLRTDPRLLVTQEQHSPFSFGVVRPTICLPEGLEDRLSRESLDLVVGHECVHVARGDGWLRPIERVTADIFWFNPFAWLIRRELDVARELAVDEAVIEMASSRIVYARALRDVASFSAGLSATAPAASMSLAGSRSLMLRVSRTLSQAKRKPARAAIIAACMAGLVGAPIAVAQVMLAVPAPAAAPEAPEAPEAIEALEAPEAPEAPEAIEAPEAPEAPPAAEFNTTDGKIHATFRAKVVGTSGDATKGYRVELLQTAPGDTGETCYARMEGLGSLSVSRDQIVPKGDVVGSAGKTGRMTFSVTCSDELDGKGYPKSQPPPVPPIPPEAPPAPVGPLEGLAPLAPVAPVAPVSPVSAIAPTPPTPFVAPTPAVAPMPPMPATPPARNYYQAPPALPAPAAPPAPLKAISLEGAQNAVIGSPGRVVSAYGQRRDPFTGQSDFHAGIDIAAQQGVAVHAPAAGSITFVGARDGRGNTVDMKTTNDIRISFAQMSETKVKLGDTVVSGQMIGTIGSSGVSTGPHLHLEVSVNGQSQDPQKVTGLALVAGR